MADNIDNIIRRCNIYCEHYIRKYFPNACKLGVEIKGKKQRLEVTEGDLCKHKLSEGSSAQQLQARNSVEMSPEERSRAYLRGKWDY